MRSQKLILEDERTEDFDRLAAGWQAEYGDEGQAAESLLRRVILNDWFLQRAERRYIEAETELAAVHPLEWTEEQHHQIELYLRYKTTAERSFYRALSAFRGLRKDKIREELDFEKIRQRMDEYAVKAVEKVAQEQAVQAEVKQAKRAAAVAGGEERESGGNLRRLTERGCECEVCVHSRLARSCEYTISGDHPDYSASASRRSEEGRELRFLRTDANHLSEVPPGSRRSRFDPGRESVPAQALPGTRRI